MGIHKDLAEALDTRVEDSSLGLGLNCIKGFPSWGKPGISVPLATVLWEADEVERETARISKHMQPIQVTTFMLTAITLSEVDLWAAVDSMYAMVDNWERPVIGGKPVTVEIGRADRVYLADETTEDLRYAAQAPILFRYVR